MSGRLSMTGPRLAVVILILAAVGLMMVWRLAQPPQLEEQLEEVVGVVTAVDGDLETVESFDLLSPGGATLRLVPDPDGRFDFPLPHLGTHMRSLDPVRVSYRAAADRTLIAVLISDG